MVPTFALEPLDGLGAQLYPCNLATATLQAFAVASGPATSTGRGVLRARARICVATQPGSARFELVAFS